VINLKSAGSSAPEALKGIYNEAAASYDATRLKTAYQQRFDRTERNIIRRYLHGVKHTLEVGGGTGRLTAELLAKSESVTVVDIAPNMLAKLKEKHPDEARLSVHVWNVFDLKKLPGYGEFDAVVSMRMLPHIEDTNTALTLLAGAVRAGGLLIFDFWNPNSYTHWKKRGAKVYNNYVSYDDAVRTLNECGLELIRFEGAGFHSPINVNLEFLGRTPLKRFAYSLIAVCKRPVHQDSTNRSE
jgi:ubiquinone/menaquinone biosynthesis C-methylase UbiE